VDGFKLEPLAAVDGPKAHGLDVDRERPRLPVVAKQHHVTHALERPREEAPEVEHGDPPPRERLRDLVEALAGPTQHGLFAQRHAASRELLGSVGDPLGLELLRRVAPCHRRIA
jgi:hypothetical protein